MLRCKGRLLSHTSKACKRCFEDDNIVNDYKHIVNGQEVRISCGNLVLVPSATSRFFPGLEERISKSKYVQSRWKSSRKAVFMQVYKSGNPSIHIMSSSSKPCIDVLVPNQGVFASFLQAETSTMSAPMLGDLVTMTLPFTEWWHEAIQDEISGEVCGVLYFRKLAVGPRLLWGNMAPMFSMAAAKQTARAAVQKCSLCHQTWENPDGSRLLKNICADVKNNLVVGCDAHSHEVTAKVITSFTWSWECTLTPGRRTLKCWSLLKSTQQERKQNCLKRRQPHP